jgi:hypothetical protein
MAERIWTIAQWRCFGYVCYSRFSLSHTAQSLLSLLQPRPQIMFLTTATSEKRRAFSNLMLTILVNERKTQDGSSSDVLARWKKKSRPKKRLPSGILDSIVGVAAADNDDENNNGDRGSSTESDGETAGELEAAIRASLDEFEANVGALDVLNVDNNDAPSDWPCQACTYVNSSGRRCAMCGSAHS